MALLEVINITKEYSGHKALDNVSINVEDGKIFGLLGPNGAGKTTLIRIINAITGPDSGQVLLNGNPLTLKDTANIGYLPEERGLYKKMKAGEQAVYLARLKGLTKHDAERELKYWFEKFDIISWWDKKIEELSKGMAQKIQFIITVLHKPQLLIFDEPFSGFDPVNTELLKNEILELKNNGATIIFSTHNMDSVERLCDNIALIDHSRVVLSGEINEVRNRYKENIYETVLQCARLSNAPSFTIQQQINKKDGLHASLSMNSGYTPNDIIADLIQAGTISYFKETLPSMNDIFIRSVK